MDVQKNTGKFTGKAAGSVLLTLAAALALWLFIAANHRRNAVEDIKRSLLLIHSYKTAQISAWHEEHSREATRFSRHPIFGAILLEEMARPGSRRAELTSWLKEHLIQKQYSSLAFLSPKGAVIAATPAYVPGTEKHFTETFAKAARTGTASLTDLYLAAGGKPRMTMISPIPAGGRGGGTAGLLVINIDPQIKFYPILKAAPLFIGHAETLLVRKEGDQALFLNPLDHRKDSALKFALPLSEGRLPAAAALSGDEGFFAGADYRGVKIFGALGRIPGTNWLLVTKVDRDTILAPVKERERLALAMILLAAVILYALFYIALLRRGRASREIIREGERRLAALFSNLPGAAYRSVDPGNWTINFLSEGCLGLTGYRPEELLTGAPPGFFELIIPEDRERVRQIMQAGLGEGRRYELTYSLRCKDGSVKTVWEQGLAVGGADGRPVALEGFISDITPLKRAETALKVGEQIFREFLEHSPVYVFFKDEKIRPIHLSRNYEALIGKPLGEILGRSMDELFPSDLAKSMVADDLRILKEGKEITVEEEFNGRSYRTIKFPLTLEGKPPYLAGFTIDVTEQKLAEEERLSHLRFLENMDRVNRAVQGAQDLETMMSDVLNTALKLFDCDRVWLLYPCDPEAPSFRVPMEITRPEYPGAKLLNIDVPIPPDMALNLREALESPEPVTYTLGTEKTVNKLTVEQFDVKAMLMTALYPKSGKPWLFGLHQCSYPRVWTNEEIKLMREIGRRLADSLTSLLSRRELQESEESLKEAHRLARLGNWKLDLVSNRLTWSDELYRIFELDPDKFGASYEAFLETIHPDDRAYVDKAYTDSVKNRSGYNIVHRLLMNDGRVKYVNERCETSYAPDGRPLASQGTSQDITEMKLAELELEKLNWDLTAKKQEMENFLYITTHDLRGPLINIQGFAQNIERYMGELREELVPAPLPQPVNEVVSKLTVKDIPGALRFIVESSRKMDSLISSLLKVARLGRVEMKPRDLEMNDLLKKIVDSTFYQLEEAGAAAKVGVLPPCKADPAAVSQIFANLLENAIKYRADDRPLVISITGEARGVSVRYKVTDNGSGIAARDLGRIWDIFYRGAGAGEGEGIGLTVVKYMTEKNGGSIRAESEEGRGSVFFLELPAAGGTK